MALPVQFDLAAIFVISDFGQWRGSIAGEHLVGTSDTHVLRAFVFINSPTDALLEVDVLDEVISDASYDLVQELEEARFVIRNHAGDTDLYSIVIGDEDLTQPYALPITVSAAQGLLTQTTGIQLHFLQSDIRMVTAFSAEGTGASAVTVVQPTPVRLAASQALEGTGGATVSVLNRDQWDWPISEVGQFRTIIGVEGGDDDQPVRAELLSSGGTASLDFMWVSASRTQIKFAGTTGRFSTDAETRFVWRIESPEDTLLAALQGIGGKWQSDQNRYRIDSGDVFLVGTQITLNTAIRARGVGAIIRLKAVEPAPVRISASQAIAGFGEASTAAVVQPTPVRIATSRALSGLANSRVTVVPGVRMETALAPAGIGASTVSVVQATGVRLVVRHSIAGFGSSWVSVRFLVSVLRMRTRLGLTGIGSARVRVFASRGSPATREIVDSRGSFGYQHLYALEIDHPDYGTPARLVGGFDSLRIDGEIYEAVAFEVEPPQDVSGETRKATLRVDNVGRALMDLVHATSGARGASMRLMSIIAPEASEEEAEIVWEVTMSVGVAEITNRHITVQLADEAIHDRPSVTMRHDPVTSPGLF